VTWFIYVPKDEYEQMYMDIRRDNTIPWPKWMAYMQGCVLK